MKKKIILIVIVILLLAGLIYLFIFKEPVENTNQKKENDKQVLDTVLGDYLAPVPEVNEIVKGVYITKEENKYYIEFYQTHSDGFYYQEIIRVEQLSETYQNKYYLTIKAPEIHSEMMSINESYSMIELDISKIDDNVLILDNTEYTRYNGNFNDWDNKDKFFQNKKEADSIESLKVSYYVNVENDPVNKIIELTDQESISKIYNILSTNKEIELQDGIGSEFAPEVTLKYSNGTVQIIFYGDKNIYQIDNRTNEKHCYMLTGSENPRQDLLNIVDKNN